MAEGLQAGRLEVPVVADLAGFAGKLRTAVETAAEGVAAKIKVEVDSKGLRRRLKDVVKEASKGVTAKIRVEIDEDRFRVSLDDVRRRIDEADLNIPVRPREEGDARGGGIRDWIRRIIEGGQDEADRNPIDIPVAPRLPGRGRGGLRMLGIGALVSLAQPAVALLGQYAAGLTALVSAAAPAVGVLGAIPGLIASAGAAAIGTKVAFAGFGDALKESLKAQGQMAAAGKLTEAQQAKLDSSLQNLSASAQKSVKTIVGLSGAWKTMRQSVQERFFSRIADDIKPVSDSILPLLRDSLGSAADQMGRAAERGSQFLRSGIFRRDFKTIAGTNSRVLSSMTGSLGNLGRASLDFLVASGPFVERVGKATERATQWVRASVAAGRETGSLAKFLDHAGDKAAQLGRATGGLIRGLGGVGRAAMDTGNALLDGLEGSMLRFDRWANSGAGQKAMKQFFADAAPAFHEVNLLFGDMMRGLGRAMKDGGITDLVRQIRVELMPALGAFFDAIGQSVGPAVISVISNLAEAIAGVSEAGVGLGLLLTAFGGLVSVFNTLMTAIPGANTALAVFLGLMLTLKVVSAVTGMFRGFAIQVAAARTSLGNMSNTLRGIGPGQLGPQISLWGQMRNAYQGAATEAGRLGGAMRGIGAANRVASTALGGMTAALGGPLGIAIAAITIGLGYLASRQEAAARAAQAHKDRVEALSDALTASGGAIDANVRAKAAMLLQGTELEDGEGRLVDVMAKAGIELGDLTNAYLKQGKTLGDLEKELQATADAHWTYETLGRSTVYTLDAQGKAAKAAKDALATVRGELEGSQKRNEEISKAVNDAGTKGVSAYDRLSAAVQTYSNKTKSADERTEALKRALDALSGGSDSVHDATARLNQQLLDIDDTMKSASQKTGGWGKALVTSNGEVNTATRNGQTLNQQLNQLKDSALGLTVRYQEAAEQGLMPMSEAMEQSQGAMNRTRTKALELAAAFNIPKAEAEKLVNELGLVPSTVTTIMTTGGVPKATAEFLALRTQLMDLERGRAIRITAPTPEVTAQLQTIGFNVQRIPGTKDVEISARTDAARGNLQALTADIAAAPDRKSVTVEAIVKQAAGDLKGIRDKVADMKGKSIEVKAPTQVAQKALQDLGYKIEKVDKGGKTVRITVPTQDPVGNVQTIQSRINNLTGRTVHVTVQYHSVGKPSVIEKADGGIVKFADGGFHGAASKIRAFANGGLHGAASRIRAFASGTEKHIAQIAKAGEMRLWAEPETYPGEAYIPLAPSKRRRSEEILDTVADFFGGTVVYPGRDLRQFADGALRLQQNATRASAPRRMPAPPNPAPSLVGGDLNLNMATGSAGDAIGDAMFELRRIKLGGAYASG
ncbi:hypothetical protein ABTY59_31765 [Streptomyces sp. NPDC096079]|uniref:hypothetical protein n=1 Tax=Streptomyces sp. NPDC096079 TaxID=3155820 RepID=UPI00333323E6